MSIAACDEDSAFTYVAVPEWMTAWQAGPPVLASHVWDLLDPGLKNNIEMPSKQYVAPKYQRLAMGGSHSVYILMRINIHHTGKALLNYSARLRRTVATTDLDDVDETADISPLGEMRNPTCWLTKIGSLDSAGGGVTMLLEIANTLSNNGARQCVKPNGKTLESWW